MNIGKVKTVFIFLFLIINIFLVYVSLYFESDSIHISNEEIKRTEKILLDYNITMNNNIINSVYNNMNYINIINPVANKTDFAYTLTGSSFGNSFNFNGKNGRLSFKDGGFLYFPKNRGKNIKAALPSQSAANKALNTLSSYGFKTQNLKWQGSVLKNKYYEISYLTSYQGFDFFNSELKCLADEEGIYSVFGKYFEVSGITKSDGIKSPLEILISFAVSNEKAEEIHINNLEIGYYVNSKSENFSSLTAQPCFKITLKNGNTVFYDAVQGNLIEYIKYNS